MAQPRELKSVGIWFFEKTLSILGHGICLIGGVAMAVIIQAALGN